jgi:hypothetical protein
MKRAAVAWPANSPSSCIGVLVDGTPFTTQPAVERLAGERVVGELPAAADENPLAAEDVGYLVSQMRPRLRFCRPSVSPSLKILLIFS